ncbi:MAG: Stp1/IreP family PP2C-type Ser/Thr phosphatase [candidate division Zixibacteria bacterium]|nr:Stp1/IreP family PP2C-type Ser/Thr phosphatase [candidate division Zixibacteria bacterium]
MIQAAGKTDIGLVRKLNEDSIKLLSNQKLFIVCDGMGGHSAGEVASKTACDIIANLYKQYYNELLNDDQLKLPRMFPPSTDILVKAVRIANHWIYKKSSENPSLQGMGTTIVAAAVEKDIVTLLHVGDSRIYRLASRKLYPLTIDHSWAAELEQSEKITAEEAKTLVNRNVITRALGVKQNVEIDVAVKKIQENDIYILCSDGLCGFVDDGDIRDVAVACEEDVDQICNQLVRLANERGGSDNVSIVAFRINGKVEPSALPSLDTVTVDGESSQYFSGEEEWAAKSEDGDDDDKEDDSKSKGFSIISAIFIITLLAAIFYLVFKG